MGFENRKDSSISLVQDKSDQKGNAGEPGIWSSILSEVVSGDLNRLPSSKQLVLLGDSQTGKTTLVAKLQGNEDPKKGAGLEYAHILVKDEYRDVTTRLSVWTLDGDPAHAHLLKFALRADQLADTVVVLTVAMTTPWEIMDQLHSWATVIQDHLDQLDISTDEVRKQQAYVQRRWQHYTEPGDELDAAATTAAVGGAGAASSGTIKKLVPGAEDAADDALLLPLGDSVLTRNLGLDMVVVVTKTDYMTTLEKDHDYKEEHFDFIQQYVRKFSLQYGAALFYTSVKEDKNCDLLYKYLTHRIYGFPFKTPALVVEKDAVFIPAGWDSHKKISILHEGMHSLHPEAYYTDIIARPIIRKTTARDADEHCEDEQVFLGRLQQKVISGGGGGGGGISAGLAGVAAGSALAKHDALTRSPMSAMQKTPERRIGSSTALAASLSSGKKLEASKPVAGVTSEGMLANFFNSLLNKKTGSTPPAASVSSPVIGGGGSGGGGGGSSMTMTGSPATAMSPTLKNTAVASVTAAAIGSDTTETSMSPTDVAAELDRMARASAVNDRSLTPATDANCSDA